MTAEAAPTSKKHAPLLNIGRAVWTYSAGKRHFLFLILLFSTIAKTVDLAVPYLFGRIVNTLQERGADIPPDILQLVLALAAVKIIILLTEAPSNALELHLGKYATTKLATEFYQKFRSMPLLWHNNHHSGDMISRVNKGVSALQTMINFPERFLWIGIGFFGPIAVLFSILPPLGFMTFMISLTAMLCGFFIDKKIKAEVKKNNELYHGLYAALTDYINNIRTIVTLRLGMQTSRDITQRAATLRQKYHKEVRFRMLRWVSIDTLVELTLVSCIAYVVYAFQRNTTGLTIGDLVMVITYLRQMSMSIYNASRLSHDTMDAVANYESLDLLYDAHAALPNTSAEHDTVRDWSHLAVRDLNFVYKKEAHNNALTDISFTLYRGQKIALVGSSGAGKSTLMSVLRGLYDAPSGTMTMDDQAHTTLAPIAAISTLIPQEPEIFENTIRYNITLGLDHSDEEIMDSCRIACFDTVLPNLPNGLESKINEKGVNLSGGQKQRLALARGIFAIRESSLVLFDEPTSSVDSLTERRMYRHIFAAFPNIAMISSIHRLNLLDQFDAIWVMEQGRIVQQGPLATLTTEDGPFRTLWLAYQNADAP